MELWIILIAWALGMLLTFKKINLWFANNTWYEKAAGIILWPLTFILHGIYLLNKTAG